ECHIQSDWLLLYRIKEDVLVLTLVRTGTYGSPSSSSTFFCGSP
ncbi:MAG: type II toxin-antitoxin system mRNA interferase toxin, RelE/StbE family, partial [Synergistaceae bacterium]|nr:type II toxin-antitoxin system mRNA interferase toxin, RelE/StbE family [Synergistaceae bacterium]